MDSSDVELLLEYGYPCDETEDMLADHNMFQEAIHDCNSIVHLIERNGYVSERIVYRPQRLLLLCGVVSLPSTDAVKDGSQIADRISTSG